MMYELQIHEDQFKANPTIFSGVYSLGNVVCDYKLRKVLSSQEPSCKWTITLQRYRVYIINLYLVQFRSLVQYIIRRVRKKKYAEIMPRD